MASLRLCTLLGLLLFAASALAADATALYHQGYDRFTVADFGGAATYFEQVLAQEPGHRAARNRLAECYLQLGRAEDARTVAAGVSPETLSSGGGAIAPGTEAPSSALVDESRRAVEEARREADEAREDAASARREAQEAREAARDEEARSDRAARDDARRAERAARDDERRAKEEAEKAVRQAAQTPEERARRRNPRAFDRGEFSVVLGGPAGGLGAKIAVRPHWIVALGGGVGVIPGLGGTLPRSVLTVSADVEVLPLPWRLTPVIGVGVGAVLGPAAWRLDTAVRAVGGGKAQRAVPYAILAVRYDARKCLSLQVGAILLPGSHPQTPVVPVPTLRFGLRF